MTKGNGNGVIMTTKHNKLYIKDDNDIVGNSTTVQPATCKCNFCIKY